MKLDITRRFRLASLMAALLLAWPASSGGAEPGENEAPRIVARDRYFLGELPAIVLKRLPGEAVTVHLFRRADRWLSDGKGGYMRQPTLMHGWGRYTPDAAGQVALAAVRPEAGTSLAAGPTTLFWSARRQGDPLLADQTFAQKGIALADDGTHVLRVYRGSALLAERRFAMYRERPDMVRVTIDESGFAGVFAAPAGSRGLPTIIHLHGSEGGSLAKSRDIAQRYAEAGFATLALAYFAWPYESKGLRVPAEHRNIPVELLNRARQWLKQRPEADVNRLGLVGNSKGGEFAMLGATTYPWVRAAVGCVPSDIVWQGYGAVGWNGGEPADAPPAGTFSSWSRGGKPLAYLPTYGERRDGFLDNTDRYDRARAEFAEAARAARIPIEKTRAKLFLIGGDRDRTWPSGAMTRSLLNAMDASGKGKQASSLISPTAGHFLCGDGLYPHRVWQDDNPSAFAPDIDAQGKAEVAAHAAKLAFLRDALGSRELSRPRQ